MTHPLAAASRDSLSIFAFNLATAAALVLASVTNIGAGHESLGVYLLPYIPATLAVAAYSGRWTLALPSRLDLPLIVFLLATLISAALNGNSKTLTYLVLYGFAFFFLAVVLRNAIMEIGWAKWIHVANLIGTGVTALLCIAEFTARSLWGSNFLAALPLVNPPSSICGIDTPRTYALAVEPTYLVWYLLTLGPIAIWFVWRSRAHYLAKILFTYLISMAAVTTWATTGFLFFCAVVATVIYVLIMDRKHLAVWRRMAPAVAIRGAFVASLIIATLLALVPVSSLSACFEYAGLKPVVQANAAASPVSVEGNLREEITRLQAQLEASRSEQNVSTSPATKRIEAAIKSLALSSEQLGDHKDNSMSRFQLWMRDIEKWTERPIFGWGPAYNTSIGNSSSLSFFVAVLLENGMIAFIALFAFLVTAGLKIARSNLPHRYVLLVPFIFGSAHWLTQARFFFPYVWIVLCLFWMEQKRYDDKGTGSCI